MSTGILAAVEVNPATPSHAQLSFCSSGDRPTAPMRRYGSSREPARRRGACGLLPRYGAFDLGLAVSVPLPIVTGIFVLLWFQSRLT